MGAGRSKEPPPEPTFAEIGAMVVEKLRTTVDAQMPFEVTLEILIAMVIGLMGMLLLLKTAAKKAVGSKAIEAVCELSVAGKPGGAGSTVAISPSPGVTDRPKSHLERTPSAKQFVPERASSVSGTVKLVEVDGACVIEYLVSGLQPGKHGFQIHETADFSSVNPIYNPHGKNHGGLEDANRKVGDLGNIVADPTGVAKGTIRSNLVRLNCDLPEHRGIMLALTSAAAFTAYLQQGVMPSRIQQSRVGEVSMNWRQTYNGKEPGAPLAGQGAVGSPVATASAPAGVKKQDFLEAEPYWDQSTVPVNTYKNKSPFLAKVVSVKRIVGPEATGETCDIVMEHGGKMPYWEGQSYGVIPPGTNPKNGKPNSVRLYSIASSRYGDDMTGTTTTLCVRRATYWCPELKADDPAKKGVCSNFLCDASPGAELKLTGPSGKVMLMPEKDPNVDLIMVATGTGIAPYRSFLKRLFVETTPFGEVYKGLAWLFLGVANSDALLYDDDWQVIKAKFPDNFRVDYALSREQTNVNGGKMYIQDKVAEYSDEVFTRMDNGAHMYFCGLKGMMPGITEMLEGVSKEKGIVWEEKLKEWKKAGQWHVEVY